MCRYAIAGPYKSHFACFTCRKAFKQPPCEDYWASRGLGYIYRELQRLWANKEALQRREQELGHSLSDLGAAYRSTTHQCPECGGEMIDIGLDFKPPKQNDAKAWKILHGMFRVGHAFHTCGCDGPGWIPRSTNDYRSYLASRKQEYQHQLELIQCSNTLSAEGKQEAAQYWTARIEAIEREAV